MLRLILAAWLMTASAAFATDAVIVRWYDGDTCTVRVDAWPPLFRTMSVRVSGIDTPEMRDPNPTVRRWAYLAKQKAERLAPPGSKVTLTNEKPDKYFRVNAEVLANGVSVGRTQLSSRLAKPYDGKRKVAWKPEDCK